MRDRCRVKARLRDRLTLGGTVLRLYQSFYSCCYIAVAVIGLGLWASQDDSMVASDYGAEGFFDKGIRR